MTDTGYEIGLTALYPAWVELAYAYSPDKLNWIGEHLSGRKCEMEEEMLDALLEFMDVTRGRLTLRDFGFAQADASRLGVYGNRKYRAWPRWQCA